MKSSFRHDRACRAAFAAISAVCLLFSCISAPLLAILPVSAADTDFERPGLIAAVAPHKRRAPRLEGVPLPSALPPPPLSGSSETHDQQAKWEEEQDKLPGLKFKLSEGH